MGLLTGLSCIEERNDIVYCTINAEPNRDDQTVYVEFMEKCELKRGQESSMMTRQVSSTT